MIQADFIKPRADVRKKEFTMEMQREREREKA